MTTLWKDETLTKTQMFSVLLYDPHKGHGTRLKLTWYQFKKYMEVWR